MLVIPLAFCLGIPCILKVKVHLLVSDVLRQMIVGSQLEREKSCCVIMVAVDYGKSVKLEKS